MDLILRRFIPIKKIREKHDYNFELCYTGCDTEMNVPYLSGCFMVLRVSALKEIGLFDERFFMYPEDIDLTRRMHAKYRTMYIPYVTIMHDHAKAPYKNLKMLFIHIIIMIRYFNKWSWFFDKERKIINQKIKSELKKRE